VAGVGDQQHLEGFVGLDQSVHQAKGLGRGVVAVHVPAHQKQLSLEVFRVSVVGFFFVVVSRLCGPVGALVLFSPVPAVDAKVVVTNCFNCMTQIRDLNKAYELNIEVKSIVELVAESLNPNVAALG